MHAINYVWEILHIETHADTGKFNNVLVMKGSVLTFILHHLLWRDATELQHAPGYCSQAVLDFRTVGLHVSQNLAQYHPYLLFYSDALGFDRIVT